jgi:hypothetical protein
VGWGSSVKVPGMDERREVDAPLNKRVRPAVGKTSAAGNRSAGEDKQRYITEESWFNSPEYITKRFIISVLLILLSPVIE